VALSEPVCEECARYVLEDEDEEEDEDGIG
jgi:hypothetical protein